ncbi:hypothetical protein KC19_4G107400 [Ceratodon purpureus]|uniref:F-box protein n=2 Tax=Ceratodon purpureus TaxID=3225 RepID=A0A8T0IAP8_CERPU|nr:hypothetical protein KC19_4G107400 [Ceratodon purpureus]
MEGRESGVLAGVEEPLEEEELRRQMYRLCGFAVVVVKVQGDDLRPDGELGEGCLHELVGAKCSLQGRGWDVHVRVERSGLCLEPLVAEDVVVEEERGQRLEAGALEVAAASEGLTALSSSQIGGSENWRDCKLVEDVPAECAHSAVAGARVESAVKRKRGGVGSGSRNGEGLLHQLQWLSVKNHVRVQGCILAIARKGGETRALAMLDVYLPSSAWMGPGFWKSGVTAAAAISHLSCDWEKRRMLLTKLKSGNEIIMSENVWEQGGCHVLGCKFHQAMSESTKARFDLHSLFKSLATYKSEDRPEGLKLLRDEDVTGLQAGIWDVPDEIITSIFSRLLPKDLHNVAAVCRYTRLMAVPIMPCMHLQLFPHQQSAVRWMLQRENRPGVLAHPLYKSLETEDGFPFYLDTVSGELSPETPPEVQDFRGGLFCDEPGLGKTVTALSLILKTQGASADPPPDTEVYWVPQGTGERMGYYEMNSSLSILGRSALKRSMLLKARKNNDYVRESDRVSVRRLSAGNVALPDTSTNDLATRSLPAKLHPEPLRSSIRVKRKLGESFEIAVEDSLLVANTADRKKIRKGRHSLDSKISSGSGSGFGSLIVAEEISPPPASTSSSSLYDGVTAKRASKRSVVKWIYEEENWVQCEACSKWRKLPSGAIPPKNDIAWFCSLNPDSMHQKCTVPQESDSDVSVKSLPGFYKTGTDPGQPQNVAFFASILKENAHLYDECARRPVMWLADLNSDKLAKLAAVGLAIPREAKGEGFVAESSSGDTLFKLFGLVSKKPKKGPIKWFYPKGLDSLVFDTVALREAARKPRDDATRLYLSRATLIVVTQSLVEHWRHQIVKHTTPGQLRVYVWTDHKKPAAAHNLAWDYDIVVTTFNRLSSEWSNRENSVLMRVHWLRIMLDEGHTLGASLSLTNKLQMAKSLHASRRWILTGTPTPNTPSSQAAYLRPMLEFLHENLYSKHQKLWDNAILRPFEAGCEEGRSRLLQLLHRTMISSRKSDLCTIPPCIRKVKLLDFTEAHAATYNELVVTVQRNILLADWRDPSHVESLLNPKQWKFRSTTLRNIRLSCCVAGHIKVGMSGEDVHETVDLLVEEYGLINASDLYYKIQSALIHGGTCDRCQIWCRLPVITPCLHLLCLSCVAMDCEKCTMSGCGHLYKMQSPAELARPENPTPKWPVPQDLIELQPSYAQDDWDPDWHATSSSKVAYLVDQLKVIQDNNLAQQYSFDTFSEAKADWFNSTMLHTYSNNNSTCSLPFKAIVFSQFLEHINVIEQQLKGAGIHHVGMYSPMPHSNRMKSLVSFQKDPVCTVLVMDASASLGLDLSFVTHVYLMEPIWDGR